MMETKEMSGIMKDAPIDTTSSGMYLTLVDANGEPHRISNANILGMSLSQKEEAKSYMNLVDFLRKYVKDKSVGFILTDRSYNFSVEWYLTLKAGLSVSLQNYMILLTKRTGTVDSAYCCISFLLLPCDDSTAYSVTYVTRATASDNSVKIRKWSLTTV